MLSVTLQGSNWQLSVAVMSIFGPAGMEFSTMLPGTVIFRHGLSHQPATALINEISHDKWKIWPRSSTFFF